MKKIILLIITVFLTSLCYSDISIDDFNIITATCTNEDGGQCSTDTTCNMTSFYPNKSIWYNNVNMTRSNNTFYYEATTTITGEYDIFIICCNTEYCRSGSEPLIIIDSFNNYNFTCNSNWQSLIYYVFILILLIGCIYFTIYFENGLLYVLSCFGLMIFGFFLYNCFWIIGIVISGLGIYMLLKYIAKAISDS